MVRHLAMVKAQNLQHLKPVAHRNDAFNHLLGYCIVAEVEGEESTKVADGVNHAACPFWEHLQLFHLEVLQDAVRVLEQRVKQRDY